MLSAFSRSISRGRNTKNEKKNGSWSSVKGCSYAYMEPDEPWVDFYAFFFVFVWKAPLTIHKGECRIGRRQWSISNWTTSSISTLNIEVIWLRIKQSGSTPFCVFETEATFICNESLMNSCESKFKYPCNDWLLSLRWLNHSMIRVSLFQKMREREEEKGKKWKTSHARSTA